MASNKRYLGADDSISVRRRIYLTEDALEVDEVEGIDVNRIRVYFDDVLLMTYHKVYGVGFIITNIIFCIIFGSIALATSSTPVASVIFTIIFILFFLFLVLRLVLRVDIISVYGRRTMVRIRFSFRKGRARRTFEQVANLIHERQAQIASSMPPPVSPPPSPLEPMEPPQSV